MPRIISNWQVVFQKYFTLQYNIPWNSHNIPILPSLLKRKELQRFDFLHACFDQLPNSEMLIYGDIKLINKTGFVNRLLGVATSSPDQDHIRSWMSLFLHWLAPWFSTIDGKWILFSLLVKTNLSIVCTGWFWKSTGFRVSVCICARLTARGSFRQNQPWIIFF